MDNKEIIKQSFKCGDTPSDADFAKLIDNNVGVLSDVLQLPPANLATLGTSYIINNVIHTCIQNPNTTFSWKSTPIGSGGGTDNYNELLNRPRINGFILSGDTSPNDLGVLRDNGGYTLQNPFPNDIVYIVRNGQPFVCRVSDMIRSAQEARDVVLLEDITDTPPVIFDAIVGVTQYFNTVDGLIYVANTIATWSEDGFTATEGIIYMTREGNSLYRFEGSMIDLTSGGSVGDAAAWLEGEVVPSVTLGNIGDWYINTLTGDVYNKTSNTVWTFKLNIKGTDGTNGTDGIDGADGVDGKNIELQNNGEYIQWRFVGSETWANLVALSELKGAKGDTGEKGDTGANWYDDINIIENTTATSLTLAPEPNTFYKFGTLSTLNLTAIPNSVLPIVMWFSSGTTETSLTYPTGTQVLSGSSSLDKLNTTYELIIVNSIISITESPKL